MTSCLSHLQCERCSRVHPAGRVQHRCACGGTLYARYDLDRIALQDVRSRPAGTWRYRELLPVKGEGISLGEGETPLLFLPRLSERWGVETYVKDESGLPGGTFKARGACIGMSRAHELGARKVVMPSAGNAGGAWALYAARGGVQLAVVMSKRAPSANRLEVQMAGSDLVLVGGTIADAARRASQIAEETGAYLAATFSEPYRLEGKKTAWLEAFDQLGDDASMRIPRTVIVPVGGGVGAVAVAKAASELRALGWAAEQGPAIVGVQSERCAPLVRAFHDGADDVAPWAGGADSIAAGLNVPAPSEGKLVLDTVRASGGEMVAVSEREIVDGVRELASSEGVFACPEGGATIAAAARLAQEGRLQGPVVLYNTGAGAKYAAPLQAWSSR